MIYPTSLMFISMLIFSTALIISSPSWLCMWMGIEMNMMAFIPMIYHHKNSLPSESSLKYFLTQTFASMIMLMSIIIMMNHNSLHLSAMIMSLSMSIKLGAAPFHMWFPTVAEGLPWIQNFILMTWQKVGPMTILMSNQHNEINSLVILSSLSMGPMMALNQTSMRKIMAYSSITHMSWIIIPIIILSSSWILYLMIYFLTTLLVTVTLNSMNMFTISQVNTTNSTSMKLSMFINILSMGGFPPLLGFIGKWIILNELIMNNMVLLTTMLIMSSWMNLYIYLRILHQSMHNYSSIPKYQTMSTTNSMNLISALMSMSTMIMMMLM